MSNSKILQGSVNGRTRDGCYFEKPLTVTITPVKPDEVDIKAGFIKVDVLDGQRTLTKEECNSIARMILAGIYNTIEANGELIIPVIGTTVYKNTENIVLGDLTVEYKTIN